MKEIPTIHIVSQKRAVGILSDERSAYYQSLISIGWSGYEFDGIPKNFSSFSGPRLRLNINDVSFLGIPGACARGDIEKLVEFVPQITGQLLVHCHAGLSRSPAAALIVVTTMLGGRGGEQKALEYFHKRLRGMPNVLMMVYADHVFGCGGDLYFAFLKSFYDKDYPELIALHEQTKPPRLGCGVQ